MMRISITALLCMLPLLSFGRTDNAPYIIRIDRDWTFALGNAASMEADFTHGTEYFSYLTKVRSTGHSHAPIMPEFDDTDWERVSLPHDWVVDLPYDGEASHSHGYKCVGWKYPENSVGWYRKHLEIPAGDKGKQIWIEFEGIYRDAEVFCNGFFLGRERSGYSSVVYDISPYLVYGGDNVITVRCDASLEEGWYYEGAGIYRHVYLHRSGPVAVKPYSLAIDMDGKVSFDYVFSDMSDADESQVETMVKFYDAAGNEAAAPFEQWTPSRPVLYTVEVSLYYDGTLSQVYREKTGFRTIEYGQNGLFIGGEHVKLKGGDVHLDHAGVGVGVPDELWLYRLRRLKEYGFNAVRCSHNPASPSMLDICDSLGIVVIDENRQFGVNAQIDDFRNMIERDRNHPSVVFWSVGNEEWAVERNETGFRIAAGMTRFAHSIDSTRPTTYGSSGGRDLVRGVDIFGYNYIVQNPIDEYHEKYPGHLAMGTEETSGAGTRGEYRTVPEKGWMLPLNRLDTAGRVNVIESGWKFYRERPWALGLFYWTGFDYRGEPNPMKWPATGSQYGIFDYCGYPKDEAFYLKSVWTDSPVVHVCGPYKGEVWVYSNCASVRLYEGKKNLGRQDMPDAGHLVFAVSGSGPFRAVGYDAGGKKIAEDLFSGKDYHAASGTVIIEGIVASKSALLPDGEDVVVLDVSTADDTPLTVSVENACFLGWGNGDPGFKHVERPRNGATSLEVCPFNGSLQLLIRSIAGVSGAVVNVGGEEIGL